MAGIVFASILTETEVLYCQRLLRRHCNYTSSCHLWLATKNKDGYGILQFQFRGRRVKVKAHRLIFYMENNFPKMDGKHVSHVCHEKACINTAHLSLETAAINNKRKICVSNGECTGHYGHKRCILRYKVMCLCLCHMHVHERHQVLQ